MHKRLILILGAALVCAGTSLAQTPEPESATVTAPAVETVVPAGPVESGGGFSGDKQGWVTIDFLPTWVRGQQLPPLVTTSVPGTPQVGAGILGQTTTSILFGNQTVNDGIRSGWRLGAGYWLDPERTLALEVGVRMVESETTLFGAASDSSTILARPFFNLNTFLPDAALVAFPGNSAGSIEA